MNRALVGWVASLAAVGGLGVLFYSLDSGKAFSRQVWGLGQTNYHEFREKLAARQIPGTTSEFVLVGAREPAPHVEAGVHGRSIFPVRVDLEGGDRIRYTTDGSIPSRRARRYTAPLVLSENTVVRARVLDDRYLPGEVSTYHFIAATPEPSLPVVSIAADPVDLWSKYSGIYANATERGRKWERQAHVAFFAPGEVHPTGIHAELRIHGGYGRQADKKSFRMRFRDSQLAQLDPAHILRSGFGDETTVVIRGDPVNPDYRMHDAVGTALADEIGLLVSRHKPVEVYLNGDYWGVYDLREYLSASFLQGMSDGGEFEVFAHDSERPEKWLSPTMDERGGWEDSLQALESLDLSSPAGHAAAANLFDLDNTIDYWAHNIIVGNVDWPHNNVHVYRRLDGDDRRWKWISWDLDHAFMDPTHNTLAWALRDRVRDDLRWNHARGARDSSRQLASTALIRSLLQSPEFRRRFVARLQVLLSLHYHEAAIREHLDALAYPLLGAYARDALRWGWKIEDLEAELDAMKRFGRERPAHLRSHLAAHFALPADVVEVPVTVLPGRSISVEGLRLPEGEFKLALLKGTELEVQLEGEPMSRVLVDEGLSIGV